MAELEPQNTENVEVVTEETVTTVIDVPRRPRNVYGGMWGPVEIGAIAVAGIALVGALLMYFFLVLPSNRELARNRSESDRLEAEVLAARKNYGDITDTQGHVGRLVSSVDDFEARFLPAVSNGQAALYQRLNTLILSHGLINTSGPDYVPLETADQNDGQQSDQEKGRSRYRSLYPGVYVTTNVEGTYQNLRRFIREIETGNDFILISAIELAPSDNDSTRQKERSAAPSADTTASAPPAMSPGSRGPQPGFPGFPGGQPGMQTNPYQGQSQIKPKPGKMHGELVSLHIELAAYFRRPNFAPTEVSAP